MAEPTYTTQQLLDQLVPWGAVAPPDMRQFLRNVVNSLAGGGVGGGGFNVFNLKPSNSRKIARGLARVRTGTSTARIAFVGDSTTAGFRSGAANADKRASSAASVLATLLNSYVVPAQADSFWGHSGVATTAAYTTFDPRVTFGAGWAIGSPQNTLGGYPFGNASTTNALVFTPGSNFDTVDVWCFLTGGATTLGVQVDAQTQQTQAVTSSLAKYTFSFTSGAALNLTRASGTGTLFIVAAETYLTGTKKLSISNMGRGSWATTDWITAANNYSPLPALTTVGADGTIIELGINDIALNGTPVATYQANMQALITAALAGGGDCWLVSFNAFDPASGAQATQDSYVAALRSLASANDIALLDWNGREGPYATANALGIQADALHINGLGHADKAQFIASKILTL